MRKRFNRKEVKQWEDLLSMIVGKNRNQIDTLLRTLLQSSQIKITPTGHNETANINFRYGVIAGFLLNIAILKEPEFAITHEDKDIRNLALLLLKECGHGSQS